MYPACLGLVKYLMYFCKDFEGQKLADVIVRYVLICATVSPVSQGILP